MEVDLGLLADAATIDVSGKINVLGVFDRISAADFPVQHPHLALVLRFVGGPTDIGSHSLTIRLVTQSGEEVLALDGELQVGPVPGSQGNIMRIPHVLNLDGVVFPNPGLYSFDVSVDRRHQCSLPLLVMGPAGTPSS